MTEHPQPSRATDVINNLGAPIYALAEAGVFPERRIGGWGTSSEGGSVTLSHRGSSGRVEVETASGEGSVMEDATALHRWFSYRTAGLRLSFPLHLHADRWQVEVPVDEKIVEFTVIGDSACTVGHGSVDERQIRLTCVGAKIESLHLSALDAAQVLNSYEHPSS